MDKRYQVFVSSTYTDLVEERHSVMLTLMKMDCIPAGMEHFPAADEEQWNFIKRIIDYSDYYLLIIGGRYGSLDDDGLSFTEKEYDYAVSKNMKVVALIHGSPETLTFQNSEQDPSLREKLQAFRDKVKTKRLVDFWTHPNELPGKVALGIMNARTMYPAIGWVRADKVSNEEDLRSLLDLKKENEKLKAQLLEANKKSALSVNLNLVDFESDYQFNCDAEYSTTSYGGSRRERRIWEATMSWKDIFYSISPYLTQWYAEESVSSLIAKAAQVKEGKGGRSPKVISQDLKTIAIQLSAYNLVKVESLKIVNGGRGIFWILTDLGKQEMIKLRAVQNTGDLPEKTE